MSNVMSYSRDPSIFENRVFRYSLFFSLLVHALLLTRISYNIVRHAPRSAKPIQVMYEKAQPPIKAEPRKEPPQELKRIKEEKLQNTSNLFPKESSFSPVLRDVKKATEGIKLSEKNTPLYRPTVERRVSVPPLKSEKINNPVYLNYYQLVRNRIKGEAYKNYSEYDSGKVYLAFVLLSNGTLKQINLIEEKTDANAYLRNIGLKSIKNSTPFPPFPENLKYPELSFNVVISFEVSEGR